MKKLIITLPFISLLSGCVTQGPTQEGYASFQNSSAVMERCLASFPEIERTPENSYGADLEKLSYRDGVTLTYCNDYMEGRIPKYELASFCLPQDMQYAELNQKTAEYYKTHNLHLNKNPEKNRLQSYKVLTEIYPCQQSL